MGSARAVYRATLGTRASLIVTVVLILVLFAVASVSHFWLLVRAVYLLGSVLLGAVGWSVWQRRGLAVSTDGAGDRIEVGSELRERLTVRNETRLPRSSVDVTSPSDLPGRETDFLVSLMAHGETQIDITTYCRRRGAYSIAPVRVRTSDPFGLVTFERFFGAQQRVLVYPKTVALPYFSVPARVPGQHGGRLHPAIGPSAVVGGVRAYARGDAERLVHWPSSLRRGELMVKQFEEAHGDDCWVVLDLAPDHAATGSVTSASEGAIEAAAAIVARLTALRLPTGLIVNGSGAAQVPAGLGPAHAQRIQEALAMAEADGRVPLDGLIRRQSRTWRRTTAVVVISSATDRSWADELLARAPRLGGVAVVLVDHHSGVGDPRLSSLRKAFEMAAVQTHVIRPEDALGEVLISRHHRSSARSD